MSEMFVEYAIKMSTPLGMACLFSPDYFTSITNDLYDSSDFGTSTFGTGTTTSSSPFTCLLTLTAQTSLRRGDWRMKLQNATRLENLLLFLIR